MKSWKRAAVRSLIVTLTLLAIACGITSLTGPAAVTIGQNATYDYVWSFLGITDPPTATNAQAELTVYVPAGWTVVSATYDGTVNSSPVSGTAATIAQPACVAAPPAGYQAFSFAAGTFPTAVQGDIGTFHITYTVGGVAGPFTLEGRGSATATSPSLNGVCGDTATLPVTVGVGAAPGVSKAFAPASVPQDTPSTLTFTLTNSNAFAATGAAFTDTYPSGLVNAMSPAAGTTCGGTVTATAGASSVSLSGGSIPASSSCTVSVAVSSSTAGSYGNTLAAGGLTTSNTPPSASAATATLNVVAAAATVPTLDPAMLALLAMALAGVAFFAMRR
jgi:hypothetical protein